MVAQIQLIPTPVIWVTRPVGDQQDAIGATGAAGLASWDYMLVVGADQVEPAVAGIAGSGSPANGDVNISGPSQSDSVSALPGSGTPNWDTTIVVSANNSESVTTLAGSGTPNWDYMIVQGSDQIDPAIATLAGSGTPNNGP